MIKLKKPGLGYLFVGLSIVFTVIAFSLFFYTYGIDGYTVNRWTVLMTALSLWCLVFLAANALFKGDKPVWTIAVYVAVAFMLTYSLFLLLQPCITPITFVFASGDLNMGDVAKNKLIADASIATAVFYVLAAACAIAAAFLPVERSFGKKPATADVGGADKASDDKTDDIAHDDGAKEGAQ